MMEACESLKPILGAGVFGGQEELAGSLRDHGQLVPIVVSGAWVIDGVKRWLAARSLGWSEIQVARIPNRGGAEISTEAWVQRWQANRHRAWNIVETAIGFQALSSRDGDVLGGLSENCGENHEDQFASSKTRAREFCRSLHITPSPHVEAALKFVAGHSEVWPGLLDNRLTLAILRDLAHHEGRLAELIRFFLGIEATMAEKRLMAGLLRQCAARGIMPDLDEIKTTKEFIVDIEKLVQPRRVEARQRFAAEIADLEFPSRTEIESDPTFEKPGVELRVSLKRHEIQRLDEIASKLRTLFQRVPEI